MTGAQDAAGTHLPSRSELAECTVQVLSRGGWGNPDVRLCETTSGPVVVKDFAPRAAWLHPLGRFIMRRERRAYRQLIGHPSVPRLLGELDALALCFEYRPGEILTRKLRGRLPPAFLEELREALSRMHECGVVHLDLRHRSNLLVGRDGHPVMLDFASAICFAPGSLAARLILPLLARIDRRAIGKWEAKLCG